MCLFRTGLVRSAGSLPVTFPNSGESGLVMWRRGLALLTHHQRGAVTPANQKDCLAGYRCCMSETRATRDSTAT